MDLFNIIFIYIYYNFYIDLYRFYIDLFIKKCCMKYVVTNSNR